jgi:DNA-binding transcriptional ArsR family regulator
MLGSSAWLACGHAQACIHISFYAEMSEWYILCMSAPLRPYSPEPNVAAVAALIGDSARSAMLLALFGGQTLPASELAYRAGVSPQSASAHLAKLVEGGLLVASSEGRHRLFRIASPDVAHALEILSAIAKPARVVALSQSTAMERLREARSCYDHLAGRLGVALTNRLLDDRVIRKDGDEFDVTERGEALLRELGIDVKKARDARRSFARYCIDWTERRPHLAGSLGAALLSHFLDVGWIERNKNERSLRVTANGATAFNRHFRLPAQAKG